VNQFHDSATNVSRVFTGFGRERHRWEASCISHAHGRPLPPRCSLLGDETLTLSSEMFVDLWRHAGSFEVAFPQHAPPGPAFARAPGLFLDAIACLRIYCGFAQAPVRGVVAGLFGAIIYFTASSAPAQESAQEPLKLAGSQLEPVKWTELAGWRADDHLAAFAAYQTSCRASRKIGRTDHHGEISGALWNVCRNAKGLRPQDADTARAFFLGIGGIPVSEAEKATLTEISSALKLAA
jgi:hypothetical protein